MKCGRAGRKPPAGSTKRNTCSSRFSLVLREHLFDPSSTTALPPDRNPARFSDLEKRLKDHGIQTVIITGTSAQGAVVGTGSGSAQRRYKVIVPVDGMSAEDTYNEQYAAWHLYKGGPAIVTEQVTLTRSDMIKFAN